MSVQIVSWAGQLTINYHLIFLIITTFPRYGLKFFLINLIQYILIIGFLYLLISSNYSFSNISILLICAYIIE